MLKKLLATLVLVVAAVLIYATTRPDDMHVERALVINAPPAAIFPLINDFRSWAAWSPYERLDPAMTKTYSGSAAGRGAVYEWTGNSDVGQGRMEITESVDPSRITIALHFMAPFEGRNIATFTLTPQGEGTLVNWAMDGPSPFMAKVMGVFIDMDNLIGKDFASGLINLKTLTEK